MTEQATIRQIPKDPRRLTIFTSAGGPSTNSIAKKITKRRSIFSNKRWH